MSSHATTPTVDLTGHFLIAMPAMVDKNFSRTLTLVCEHNEQGALGVIVNKPIDMSLDDLFERIDLTLESPRFQGQPVYFGGPVQTDRGFVLHRPIGDFQSSIDIGNGLALTSSRDVLQALGGEHEPDDVLVTLGYAGWQAGQIEWELAQNAWLTVRADPQIIFGLPPEERLVAAMQLLGVDYATLSDVAGHA